MDALCQLTLGNLDMLLCVGNFFSSAWQAICQWFIGFGDSFYQNIIAQNRYMLLLNGLVVTLELTAGAIAIGTILGIIACMFKLSSSKILNFIANIYLTIIRGTPTVVQIMIIYFVILADVHMPKIFVGIIAFGINSGAYITEIIRAGIMAVDHGQMEAGRSLGLTKGQTMARIIMPQAIKNILPTYTNEFIVLIKETSVAGWIAMEDLTKAADVIRSRTFDAFFPLVSAAMIYLILTMTFAKLFSLLERKLRESDIR